MSCDYDSALRAAIGDGPLPFGAEAERAVAMYNLGWEAAHAGRPRIEASLRSVVAERVADASNDLLDKWREAEGVQHAERVERVHRCAFKGEFDLEPTGAAEDKLVASTVDQRASLEGAVIEVDAVEIDPLVFERLTSNSPRWFAHALVPPVVVRTNTVANAAGESIPSGKAARPDTQNVEAAA